jgi:hypothetical protein
MLATELVNLMMDFIEDPSLIIIHSVVLNSVVHECLPQSIHYLNLVKVYYHTSTSSTRNVRNFVSLDCDLNVLIACEERQLKVIARLAYGVQESSSSEIDADMPFLNHVKTVE